MLQDTIKRVKLDKQQAVRFMDNIQEKLKCCGGFSFEDYTREEMDLPREFEVSVSKVIAALSRGFLAGEVPRKNPRRAHY